jgi:1,4-dihydroxy-2-naphthoate octaprenyltransferase
LGGIVNQQEPLQNPLRLFIILSRPLFLAGAALLYALGGGIAHYLGNTIDWGWYFLGQAWVTLLQLSTHYLNEYYNAPADMNNPHRTPFSGGSGTIGPGKLPRRVALMAALGCLAVLASLTVLMIAQTRLVPQAFLIMAVAFLGAFFYSTPPVQLERSGYGELITAFLVSFLVPTFSFVLQTGELHRLVAMSTFPLFAINLAMILTFELPDYATDLKYEKKTLLVRLGWQTSMTLHDILILTAFLLIWLATIFGMPTFVILPALLPLPLGLLQIWQMRRISAGIKPNWTALTLGSVALFGAMTYLIAFAFWTH